MKKLFLQLVVLSFSMLIFSCNQEKIDTETNSLLQSLKVQEDGPINNAEKQLGKLIKRDVNFEDGKSIFTLRLAAKSNELIDEYLRENKITFFSITAEQRAQRRKSNAVKNNLPVLENGPDHAVSPKEVFTELVYKNLEEGKVGFGMSIEPTFIGQKESKNARDGYDSHGNYYRECPFAWAEECDVYCYPNTFQSTFGAMQKRGIFWTTWFELPLQPGLGQVFNVDGPKYTRIGTPGWYRTYYKVTWYDAESNSSHTSEG
jgi:hypothetical protein